MNDVNEWERETDVMASKYVCMQLHGWTYSVKMYRMVQKQFFLTLQIYAGWKLHRR